MDPTINQIGKAICVLSGKGGVGKSSCAVQLAHALYSRGYKIGLLDVDLCGPSIPGILGIPWGQRILESGKGWQPYYIDELDRRFCAMSVSFLTANRDDPVIWRGPKKTTIIKQFLENVEWGSLDYLIIDTPPGTSDEHLTILNYFKDNARSRTRVDSFGAVLITTPQNMAIADVQREITFCVDGGMPIIGLIENMSEYMCTKCGHKTNIFSSGGGELLCQKSEIPFLGRLPISKEWASISESISAPLDKVAMFKDHLEESWAAICDKIC